MKLSEKGIMSCAGSIRGAIAFGLAISIDSKNRQIKEVLISSTLILVFLTTICFGAIMPFAIKLFKSLDKEKGLIAEAHDAHATHHHEGEEEQKIIDFSHPNFNKK
jgi:NhaP-type Na+/H+ or K+/H+ antiporter